MNNFKDYGFEADFEGEICFENHNGFYIGYVNKPVGKIIKQWSKNDGNCFCMEGYDDRQYDLKPIKKEWYENPNNFPCIIIQPNCTGDTTIEDDFLILRNIDDYNNFGGVYRHATKEEVLSLLVKE